MNSDWFLRMLGVVDETIDLALVVSIVFLLVLIGCTIAQMDGADAIRNMLVPIGHS